MVLICFATTQVSKLNAGSTIIIGRNFPEAAITILSTGVDGNRTTLTTYYNKDEPLSQFSSIVQCDSIAGLKLFNKAIKNGYLWNNFKLLPALVI